MKCWFSLVKFGKQWVSTCDIYFNSVRFQLVSADRHSSGQPFTTLRSMKKKKSSDRHRRPSDFIGL